jgi:hypothetical protein
MNRGRTVPILFPDGQERTLPPRVVDQDTAGWLVLARMQESPMLSGVVAPMAAYRLVALQSWASVDTQRPRDWPLTEGVV